MRDERGQERGNYGWWKKKREGIEEKGREDRVRGKYGKKERGLRNSERKRDEWLYVDLPFAEE